MNTQRSRIAFTDSSTYAMTMKEVAGILMKAGIAIPAYCYTITIPLWRATIAARKRESND
jgi:hypothetical protein